MAGRWGRVAASAGEGLGGGMRRRGRGEEELGAGLGLLFSRGEQRGVRGTGKGEGGHVGSGMQGVGGRVDLAVDVSALIFIGVEKSCTRPPAVPL